MNANDLRIDELQEIMLMTGSKKAFAEYLNLDSKQMRELERKMEGEKTPILTPMQFLNTMSADELAMVIAVHGDCDKGAAHLGVSKASLVSYMRKKFTNAPEELDRERVGRFLARYKSVRLTARMLVTSESNIREKIKEFGIDTKGILDISFSGTSAGKGRRAENEYATIRGVHIAKDLNKDDCPTAPYDFDDKEYGRVNVKSSKRFKFQSWSRRTKPHFGKFSANGRDKCDYFACFLYSEKGEVLGACLIPSSEVGEIGSFTILAENFSSKEELSRGVLRTGCVDRGRVLPGDVAEERNQSDPSDNSGEPPIDRVEIISGDAGCDDEVGKEPQVVVDKSGLVDSSIGG